MNAIASALGSSSRVEPARYMFRSLVEEDSDPDPEDLAERIKLAFGGGRQLH